MWKKELSTAILKKYNPDTEYAKRVLQKIIHDNRMFAERAFYCFLMKPEKKRQIYCMHFPKNPQCLLPILFEILRKEIYRMHFSGRFGCPKVVLKFLIDKLHKAVPVLFRCTEIRKSKSAWFTFSQRNVTGVQRAVHGSWSLVLPSVAEHHCVLPGKLRFSNFLPKS